MLYRGTHLQSRAVGFSPKSMPAAASLTLIAALTAILLGSCAALRHVDRKVAPPSMFQRLDPKSTYLKVHYPDGRLLVLHDWRVDSEARVVAGIGALLSAARDTLTRGELTVPVDSVALFETNVSTPSPVIAPMTLVTVASIGLTVYCAAHPKECFGSCPTFYLGEGEDERLRAEGFSSSVMAALEATDIDAFEPELLSDRVASDRTRDFELTMRNEAYETHVVRSVRVLVAERAAGERVVRQVRGPLRRALPCAPVGRARGDEGDVTALLRSADGHERWTPSDSTDLAAREDLRVTFARPTGDSLGLVLVSRQSLLPTFVFYESLALIGSKLGPLLARAANDADAFQAAARQIWDELGGIEVWLESADGERRLGSIFETGPLATDAVMIPLGPLPASSDSLTLRLRMARGAWRIDQASLCEIGPVVTPIAVEPEWVARQRSDGSEVRDPDALELLRAEGGSLVTLPGDAYRLHFALPCARGEAELFLESRGYYLEWMREPWLADEDPAAAARLFLDPRGALKALAPKFKRIEAEQERIFWASKYAPR